MYMVFWACAYLLIKLSRPQLFTYVYDQGNFAEIKGKNPFFEPSWVERVNEAVCMAIEDSFGLMYFLVHLVCNCGNTQIGYVSEGTRN